MQQGKKRKSIYLTVQATGNTPHGQGCSDLCCPSFKRVSTPCTPHITDLPSAKQPRARQQNQAGTYTGQSWGDLSSAPNGTFRPSRGEPAPFPTSDGCNLPIHLCKMAAAKNGWFREMKIFLHPPFLLSSETLKPQ